MPRYKVRYVIGEEFEDNFEADGYTVETLAELQRNYEAKHGKEVVKMEVTIDANNERGGMR